MKSEKLVLIADAGATHTRALVASADGRVLGAGRSGAGNAFAIGHVAACRNLQTALIAALKDAHIRSTGLVFIVVGSASVTYDGRGAKPIADDMRRYLRACPISVVADGRIALEGALAGAPGVVAVSGTGSIVLGKNSAGRVLRVGGWGPVAGDEGSAQWTGRRAIQEAAHAADGVATPTLLTDSLRRHFGLRAFDQIIDAIYAHPMTPSELGALAPLVTRAADRGDAVARAIFAEGAKALARQSAIAARRLRLRKPLVSHQGSMFTVEDYFRNVFAKELRLQNPGARFSAPSLPPLGGAFLLALQGCEAPASPTIIDAFRDACRGESENTLDAGWAKCEVALPTRYPMAGYLARKKVSQGSLDSLYIRALVLQQGKLRVCVVIADLLLISPSCAARLRKLIAKAVATPARNVIVAATHTHSGPLVDSAPFDLSDSEAGERTLEFMHELEEIFVQTAVAAQKKLQPVRASYSRTPIHGLATDRNEPKKNRVQPFILVRLEGKGSSAVFGILPCHPTVLGADNRCYSGDLHGEIARRYEQRFDVALIANGACANISTRFTRRSQTRAQVSRFASLVMAQAEASPLRACAPGGMSVATQSVRLPVKKFERLQSYEDASMTGRLAEVAREGKLVTAQLSHTPEFRRKDISIAVTLMRLGPISFAALPVELYAETGRYLWVKAKVTAFCYANGYWGYVYIPRASKADYEVISSPFAVSADNLLREAVLSLAAKV